MFYIVLYYNTVCWQNKESDSLDVLDLSSTLRIILVHLKRVIIIENLQTLVPSLDENARLCWSFGETSPVYETGVKLCHSYVGFVTIHHLTRMLCWVTFTTKISIWSLGEKGETKIHERLQKRDLMIEIWLSEKLWLKILTYKFRN